MGLDARGAPGHYFPSLSWVRTGELSSEPHFALPGCAIPRLLVPWQDQRDSRGREPGRSGDSIKLDAPSGSLGKQARGGGSADTCGGCKGPLHPRRGLAQPECVSLVLHLGPFPEVHPFPQGLGWHPAG